MFKILIFARRNAALGREEFIDRFEQDFVPFVAMLQAQAGPSALIDYRRNYLLHDDPQSTGADEIGFDLIIENRFSNRSDFITSRDAHMNPETRDEIYGRMSALLNLPSIRYVTVDERAGFSS